MTTLPVTATESASEIRARWIPVARSSGVLVLSLGLTTAVLVGMSTLVSTWGN